MTVGRRSVWVLISLVASATWLATPAAAQKIGTDLAGLNPCLYGDCEARGAWAADPFGWANPGTMPVLTLAYIPRGVMVSPSYFRLNAGGVATDISTGTVTLAADPWLFQVNAVYAEGSGAVRSLPGVDLNFRSRLVRLATAVDLGRSSLGLTGLSAGLLFGVPAMSNDLRLSSGGFRLVDSHEDHEVELTPGVHWRGGQRDWFGAGATANVVRNSVSTTTTDPTTFASSQRRGTTNAWLPRAGISLLPFVPLGLGEPSAPAGEWLGELRLGMDLEHRNISVPGEGSRIHQTGYLGADARLLPDAWNPVAKYLRLYLIGGTDTDSGWGVGAGLWGNGPLEFLSCNPAYSSRPLAKSLGDRVTTWAATCSAVVPF